MQETRALRQYLALIFSGVAYTEVKDDFFDSGGIESDYGQGHGKRTEGRMAPGQNTYSEQWQLALCPRETLQCKRSSKKHTSMEDSQFFCWRFLNIRMTYISGLFPGNIFHQQNLIHVIQVNINMKN